MPLLILKCNFLQTNNVLQILSLYNNKIGDEGATAIGHALQVPLVPWQCVLLLWDLFRCNPSELLEPFRLPKFTREKNMRRKKKMHTQLTIKTKCYREQLRDTISSIGFQWSLVYASFLSH